MLTTILLACPLALAAVLLIRHRRAPVWVPGLDQRNFERRAVARLRADGWKIVVSTALNDKPGLVASHGELNILFNFVPSMGEVGTLLPSAMDRRAQEWNLRPVIVSGAEPTPDMITGCARQDVALLHHRAMPKLRQLLRMPQAALLESLRPEAPDAPQAWGVLRDTAAAH